MDEAVVVALVETNTRLVENIEDAGKPGANLCGKPDALGLAAGKRSALAVELEVVETHFIEKMQPLPDLAQHIFDDAGITLGELQVSHDIRRLADCESADRLNTKLCARLCCERDGQNLWAQAGSFTHAAYALSLKKPEAFAGKLAFGGFVEVLELCENALKRLGRSAVGADGDRDVSFSRAVENKLAETFWQVAPCFFHGSRRVGEEAIQERGVVSLHTLVGLLPRTNGALRDCFFGIHNEVGIEETLRADPLACRAGSEVAVKGKMLRREARHGEAGRGIAKVGGEFFFDPLRRARFEAACRQVSSAQTQGSLHRVCKTLSEVLAHGQTIDDRLDEVGFCFIQADVFRIRQLDDLAVHSQADKALAAGFFNHITKLADLSGDKRRKDEEFRALGPAKDGIGDSLRRLAGYTLAGFRIMGNADRCVEQAEIVVNPGGCGDGRPGIGRREALLNRDRRGEPFDVVHIGLLHLIQKLPRISRETFDIFALSFRKECVEGERGLPRSAHAGHHHKLVARNFDIKVPQVVLAGAFDADHGMFLVGHRALRSLEQSARESKCKSRTCSKMPCEAEWDS